MKNVKCGQRSLYKHTYQTANGLQSRNSYLVHYLAVDFIYIFLFISEIYNADRKIEKKAKTDSLALREHKRSSVLGRLLYLWSCNGRANTPNTVCLHENEPV